MSLSRPPLSHRESARCPSVSPRCGPRCLNVLAANAVPAFPNANASAAVSVLPMRSTARNHPGSHPLREDCVRGRDIAARARCTVAQFHAGRASRFSSRLSNPFTLAAAAAAAGAAAAVPAARLTTRRTTATCQLTSPFLSRDSLHRLQTPPPRISPAVPTLRKSTPKFRPPVCLFEPLVALIGLAFAAATATLAFIPVTIFALSAVTAAVGCIAAVSSLLLPIGVLSLMSLGVLKFPSFALVLLFLDKGLAVLLAGYFLSSVLSYISDVSRLRAARKKNYSDHSLREMVGLDPIPWSERLRSFVESASKRSGREAWRKWQAADIGTYSGDASIGEDWLYEAQQFRFQAPSSDADRRFGWLYPSALSLVPLLNGTAWILALRQSSEDIVPPLQSAMVRNAVIYSSPALLFLLGALLLPSAPPASVVVCTPWFLPIFQSCKTVAVTASAAAGGGAGIGPFAGSSWWVSLLLGAVNLQIERDRAAEMLRCREVIEEVDERERRGREGEARGRREEQAREEEERRLREFDEVLRGREAERRGEWAIPCWSLPLTEHETHL